MANKPTQPTACPWCRGAKMVPQMDADDVPCPVCKGTGVSDQPTSSPAEEISQNARSDAGLGDISAGKKINLAPAPPELKEYVKRIEASSRFDPNLLIHDGPIERSLPKPAKAWLAIWQAQPAWSAEWMLRFIQDIQKDAING